MLSRRSVFSLLGSAASCLLLMATCGRPVQVREAPRPMRRAGLQLRVAGAEIRYGDVLRLDDAGRLVPALYDVNAERPLYGVACCDAQPWQLVDLDYVCCKERL